jgi:hypothetical protein
VERLDEEPPEEAPPDEEPLVVVVGVALAWALGALALSLDIDDSFANTGAARPGSTLA